MMKYHKIPKVEKSICTAEQKIAYNLAFSWRDTIKRMLKEAETGIQKAKIIQKGVQLCMDGWKNSYTRNDKYNTDAIFSALNSGLENYINGREVLTSYEEIGAMFPANYLKEKRM